MDWQNQEFIQSPFFVRENRRFYMFYGGYDSGLDADGHGTGLTPDYSTVDKQICLMTFEYGREWNRRADANGCSRVFIGPGAARDPCVVKFGDRWYCFYCGHHNRDRTCDAIYVRTSKNLLDWSDWKIAQYDKTSEGKRRLPESPFAVFRRGFYYLLRTHGELGSAYVFRSDNPLNFGQGDVSDYFVKRLDVVAPEIIVDGMGREYITKIYDPEIGYGIRMAKLEWDLQPSK